MAIKKVKDEKKVKAKKTTSNKEEKIVKAKKSSAVKKKAVKKDNKPAMFNA